MQKSVGKNICDPVKDTALQIRYTNARNLNAFWMEVMEPELEKFLRHFVGSIEI